MGYFFLTLVPTCCKLISSGSAVFDLGCFGVLPLIVTLAFVLFVCLGGGGGGGGGGFDYQQVGSSM